MKLLFSLLFMFTSLMFSTKSWSARVCESYLHGRQMVIFWDARKLSIEPKGFKEFQKQLKAREAFFNKNFMSAFPRALEFTGDIEESLRQYSRLMYYYNMPTANFFFEDWQNQQKQRNWLGSLELMMLLESLDRYMAYSTFDNTLAPDIKQTEDRIAAYRNSPSIPRPGNQVILQAVEDIFVEGVEVLLGKTSTPPQKVEALPYASAVLTMIYYKQIPKPSAKDFISEIRSLTSALQDRRWPYDEVDRGIVHSLRKMRW